VLLFAVNQLFRWIENDRLERVLWIDLGDNGLYAIEIASKTAQPRFWKAAYLDLSLSEGRLTVEPNDPTARFLLDDNLSHRQRKR
jgi:hypothetical protein